MSDNLLSNDSSRILYTPSAFAKQALLHLQETGILHATSPHTSRREELSSLLFFIVLSGEGLLSYSGETYPLKTGDCVLIDCRKPYSHSTSVNLWSLQWVHFYGNHVSEIYAKYLQRGGKCCFCPHNFDTYRELLTEISQIARGTDSIRDMLLCEKLTSLLTLIMKETTQIESGHLPAGRETLHNLKDYLDMHYTEKLSLDDLSARFFINKFYLTRVFKEQFGLSVNNYIIGKRITNAKELLRFSDMSIEEIAGECGFSDANYFSRIFKKIEGITPGAFRHNWRP